MASFLKNHGDIILDAVLTDYGRKLLARGDGSFNIVKFALADDEIDYTLYDNDKPSISKDAEIMKTPIMEAITNNAASMKSPLLSIAMENILFMPSMKLKTSSNKTGSFDSGQFNGYVVPVNSSTDPNKLTYTFLTSSDKSVIDGVLNTGTREITVDNGIDSDKLSYEQSIREIYPMMNETQFNIYVDNRFCSVGKNIGGNADVRLEPLRNPISIDDDSVAIYRVTNQTTVGNNIMVTDIPLNKDVNETPIKGTRGTRINFTLIPSLDLTATDTLFNKYGKIRKIREGSQQEFRTIRTSVTVEGITTGCSVEIPIMFAKVKI